MALLCFLVPFRLGIAALLLLCLGGGALGAEKGERQARLVRPPHWLGEPRDNTRCRRTLAVLAEYNDLANALVEAQTGYLRTYQALIACIDDDSPEAAAQRAEKLESLNAKKNADDLGYRKNIRALEEKFIRARNGQNDLFHESE